MNSGAGFRSLDSVDAAFVKDEAVHDDKTSIPANAARTHDFQRIIELTNLSVSLGQIFLALQAGFKIGLEPAGAPLSPAHS